MDSSTFTSLDCIKTFFKIVYLSFFVDVTYNCNDGNRQKALLPDIKERR